MKDCVFCNIIDGSIPSQKFYEDENMIIIADIEPRANKHYLAIVKRHYKLFSQMTSDDCNIVGVCLKKIAELAPDLGLTNGYRIIVNQGDDAEQTVPHLHIHILGGQKLAFGDYRL